jgi:O-antigen ligase
MFFAIHERSDALTDSGNSIIQAFSLASFFCTALLAVLLKVKMLDLFRTIFWLLPMMAWIISSTYWSAYPELTIRRAGREDLELLSIILLICTYSRTIEPIRIIFFSFLTILLMDLVSLSFPSFSYSSSPAGFMGIHGHKNIAGEFYFLAIPLFVLAVFDRGMLVWRPMAIFASIFGAALLLFSNSKTSIGLLALTALCVVAIRTLRKTSKYSAVLALIYLMIGAIAAISVLEIGTSDFVVYITGDATLTGRVDVWQYALSRWQESPYLGRGFGAMWQVGPQEGAYLSAGHLNWVMNEAHNGYLDVLAQTGIVGAVLLGIYLCAALSILFFAREERANALNSWKWFCSYVILGVLFHNLTESSFVTAGSGAWILFVAVVASAGLSRRYPNAIDIPVRKTAYSRV